MFGIMCARFRILLRTMELDMENAIQVTRMCHSAQLLTQKTWSAPLITRFADTEDVTGNRVHGKWKKIRGTACTLRGDASISLPLLMQGISERH